MEQKMRRWMQARILLLNSIRTAGSLILLLALVAPLTRKTTVYQALLLLPAKSLRVILLIVEPQKWINAPKNTILVPKNAVKMISVWLGAQMTMICVPTIQNKRKES